MDDRSVHFIMSTSRTQVYQLFYKNDGLRTTPVDKHLQVKKSVWKHTIGQKGY